MVELECCCYSCDRPATRRVYPFLDYDDGTLAVCDNDEHIPIPFDTISEIESIR